MKNSIEGIYLGARPSKLRPKCHIVQTENQTVAVWSKKKLDKLLRGVSVGTKVRIQSKTTNNKTKYAVYCYSLDKKRIK